jgi:hypothetical protein
VSGSTAVGLRVRLRAVLAAHGRVALDDLDQVVDELMQVIVADGRDVEEESSDG